MISRIRSMGATKDFEDMQSEIESCVSFLLNGSNTLADIGELIGKLESMMPSLRI